MNSEPTTPEITKKISEIQGQISKYDSKKKSNSLLSVPSFFKSRQVIYIVVPVVLFILLLIGKPSFITIDHIDINNGKTYKKLHSKKFFMWWLIFSIVLDFGIFGYFYKKSKSN
jgi:hypothetical protein